MFPGPTLSTRWPRHREPVNHNDRAIIVLVMLGHAMVHTLELSVPIFIPIWLDEFTSLELGFTTLPITAATLGLLVTVGYGLFGVGALPGGVLVDRIGSRRLIAGCLFGMGGAFLLLAIVPGPAGVGIALAVWGISASVYHPAGLSLISKGVSERGTGFAYHGVAGNLGIGLGPLATTLLLLVTGWRFVAAVLAGPALLAGLYALQARFDETAAVAEAAADGGPDPSAAAGVETLSEFFDESRRLFVGSFAVVFVIVAASGLYYRGAITFLPGLLADLPGFGPVPIAAVLPDGLGRLTEGGALATAAFRPERYVYAGLLTVGVLGQYAGGKLTDRLPVERGVAWTFGLQALLAVVFLPIAGLSVTAALVIAAAFGVALFFVQPFTQAAVAEYTPADTRGLSYGYTYLGVFGVGALGGSLAGAVLTYGTPTLLFLALGGIGAVGAALGLYLAVVDPTTA